MVVLGTLSVPNTCQNVSKYTLQCQSTQSVCQVFCKIGKNFQNNLMHTACQSYCTGTYGFVSEKVSHCLSLFTKASDFVSVLHTRGDDRGILDDGSGDVVRGAGGRHVGESAKVRPRQQGKRGKSQNLREHFIILSKCQNQNKSNKIERRKVSG